MSARGRQLQPTELCIRPLLSALPRLTGKVWQQFEVLQRLATVIHFPKPISPIGRKFSFHDFITNFGLTRAEELKWHSHFALRRFALKGEAIEIPNFFRY